MPRKPYRKKTLEELQREYYESAIAANNAIIAQATADMCDSINNNIARRNAEQSEKYRVMGQIHDMNQAEINHFMVTTGRPSWELTLGNPKFSI